MRYPLSFHDSSEMDIDIDIDIGLKGFTSESLKMIK